MSFSKHANNKANNIYVMGKDYIQKINDTTIYAEKMFYRNFTDPGKKFILSLHYNGDNSHLFVVDYKAIAGTTTIYDMHRYLKTKHNIKS